MHQALFFSLSLLASPLLLANPTFADSGGALGRAPTASYQDILLHDARSRYYLSALTLRLGIPAFANNVFEEDLAVYPKGRDILLNGILTQSSRQPTDAAIKVAWQNDALTIQVSPTLKAKATDYESLLQTALALIQQANNNQMPVINGRALKAALEQKDGIPVEILKRKRRLLSP
jgi:hypothetical protein